MVSIFQSTRVSVCRNLRDSVILILCWIDERLFLLRIPLKLFGRSTYFFILNSGSIRDYFLLHLLHWFWFVHLFCTLFIYTCSLHDQLGWKIMYQTCILFRWNLLPARYGYPYRLRPYIFIIIYLLFFRINSCISGTEFLIIWGKFLGYISRIL